MRQSSSINAPHVNTVVFEAGDDDPRIIAGTVDPSAGAGVEALEGSISLRHVDTAGEAWLKTGVADTAWTQLVAGAATVPDPFTPTDGTWNLTGNQEISGTLDVAGASTLAGLAISNDGTITTLLGAVGDYVRVGDAGTTSHGLNSEDDLMVSGRFESNGAVFADGGVRVPNNISILMGAGGNVGLIYGTAQTPNAFVAGVPTDSNAMIVCQKPDVNFDFAFALLPDPAIVVCSANQTTDERGWLTHDRSDFVIGAGKGNVRIGRNLARTATATVTASVTQTQGQQPLTADVNEVSTVANEDDVVTLQAAFAGMQVTVANDGANTLQIFPASGDDLGAGTDASFSLEPREVVTFAAHSAGVWVVASSTQLTHAEMIQVQNSTAYVIAASGQPHCYHSATVAGVHSSGWTFDGGGAGTVPAIASIADGGGGTSIDVTTTGAHGVVAGDVISISGTADAAYNKVHVVNSINGANEFNVTAAWTATDTGSVNHAASLIAGVGAAGSYHYFMSASVTSSTSNETFDYLIYINGTVQPKTEVRRKFGTGSDYGSLSSHAMLTIADGDKVSFTMQNNDTAGNTTVRNLNIGMLRV